MKNPDAQLKTRKSTKTTPIAATRGILTSTTPSEEDRTKQKRAGKKLNTHTHPEQTHQAGARQPTTNFEWVPPISCLFAARRYGAGGRIFFFFPAAFASSQSHVQLQQLQWGETGWVQGPRNSLSVSRILETSKRGRGRNADAA